MLEQLPTPLAVLARAADSPGPGSSPVGRTELPEGRLTSAELAAQLGIDGGVDPHPHRDPRAAPGAPGRAAERLRRPRRSRRAGPRRAWPPADSTW